MDVGPEILKAKPQDAEKARYRHDLRSRLGRFCEDFAELRGSGITGPEIDDWQRAIPRSPVSRKDFSTVLHALFPCAP